MSLYIYQTEPIDHWGHLHTLDELLDAAADEQAADRACLLPEFLIFAMNCAYLVAKASESDWEGDIRGESIGFFSIPDSGLCVWRHGLVWKQDNNGTSFICSPVPIPWLEECLLMVAPPSLRTPGQHRPTLRSIEGGGAR